MKWLLVMENWSESWGGLYTPAEDYAYSLKHQGIEVEIFNDKTNYLFPFINPSKLKNLKYRTINMML